MTGHKWKVGDELAFARYGWGDKWMIYTIEKITPSGRIKCGPYELNSNLGIRGVGGRGYMGPYAAEPVTDKIRLMVKRQEELSVVVATKFETLSDDQITRIAAIIKEQPE